METELVELGEVTEECLESCIECYQVCVETMTHCLQMGGKQAEARHVALLMDCADICRLSATLMLRRSRFDARMCALCKEVCEACAGSCDQFEDDAQMTDCAETCRECAAACQEMAEGATRRHEA